MDNRPIRVTPTASRETPGPRFAVCMGVTLAVLTVLIPVLTSAQGAFAVYSDVESVLTALTEILPPELKSSETQRRAWPEWIAGHDRDIRERLLRGDEDTIVNWLLFGTSFTAQPRAFFDGPETPESLRKRISQRTKDLISALHSTGRDERAAFARQLLRAKGFGFDSVEEQARLEQHLYAEVDRAVAERQLFMRREDAIPAGDVIAQVLAQSSLFQDRGLSLDTSILASFAVEQALETMKNQGLLAPNAIRRVAVIGPGLDFADKNSGYDFYPVQTMQPFTSIDSLMRLGLAARPEELDLVTLDISPRVNDHIRAMRDRAKVGTPYILRLPTDTGSPWMPGLVDYWKSVGDRIGSETAIPKPQDAIKGMEVRAIEVRSQVAGRITAMDFNVVTEKWSGPPFDLVIATNVLVYYDRLDQALAFSGIEAMLRPGGFFLTNNVVVELPASRLRSVGLMTVRHSAEKVDHLFWYRRL